MFSHFQKPKSLQAQLAAEKARDDAGKIPLDKHGKDITAQSGWLNLGVKIHGEALPEHLGLAYRDGYLYMQEQLLDQHLFLLGTTGAGKSETIKRLVKEILSQTNRHVYFVDGKGDEKLADEIRSLAHHYQRGVPPVFKLGFDTTGAVYDGFRGQPADIYNRLLALIGVEEVEGGARYYVDIVRSVLQSACKMPSGPPRSFEEVLARINKPLLLEAYQDARVQRARIERIKVEDFQGLFYRLLPLVGDFETIVGEGGFALEDVPCALFSMRVQSVGDTSRRFLDFLVEDLKDFVGKRQQHPAVLIIDEFGQFSNDNIISLLTLARSSNLGVILATQDVSSLKDETTRQMVLANARTKILMASDFPQEVAELAGTQYQIESSVQHEDGDTTGKGSARVQHAFKIDMNEAAKLRPGEAFVIRQRHTAKIQVQQIEPVALIPSQEPEQRELKDVSVTEKPRRKRPPKI